MKSAAPRPWPHGGFHATSDGSPRVDADVFSGLIDDACRERDNAQCAEAYKVAEYIVRDAQWVERVLTYCASPIIDANYRTAQMRDRQWSAYFDEALFQYPWKLFLTASG